MFIDFVTLLFYSRDCLMRSTVDGVACLDRISIGSNRFVVQPMTHSVKEVGWRPSRGRNISDWVPRILLFGQAIAKISLRTTQEIQAIALGTRSTTASFIQENRQRNQVRTGSGNDIPHLYFCKGLTAHRLRIVDILSQPSRVTRQKQQHSAINVLQ